MLSSARAHIMSKRAGNPVAKPYDLSKLEPASLDIERVKVESTDKMMVNNQRKRILMRQLLLTDKGSSDQVTAKKQQESLAEIENKLSNLIQDEIKDILENNTSAFLRIYSQDLGSLFKFRKPIEPVSNGSFKAAQQEAEAITALYYQMHSDIEAIDDFQEKSDQKERVIGQMKEKIKSFMEFNPSLGNRGVRALLTNGSAIFRAQIKALSNVLKERRAYTPQIIIPLIINDQEFKLAKDLIVKWLMEEGIDPARVKIGASIQTPEAALLAGRIAKHADFVIFDTLGMTESVIAVTEKDSETFMPKFVEMGIYAINPFEILSENNVGKFIGIAKRRVLETNPDMPIYLTGSVMLARELPLSEAVIDLEAPVQNIQSDKNIVETVQKAI
ncbi:MAG: putative PEP-binding protein [Candidatus Omnitrophota bacterium]